MKMISINHIKEDKWDDNISPAKPYEFINMIDYKKGFIVNETDENNDCMKAFFNKLLYDKYDIISGEYCYRIYREDMDKFKEYIDTYLNKHLNDLKNNIRGQGAIDYYKKKYIDPCERNYNYIEKINKAFLDGAKLCIRIY